MLSCPFCTRKIHPRNLSNHMISHTKEKPHKCLKCSAEFGRAGTLKQHIKSVHDSSKPIRKKRNYQCPLCSYECESKINLKFHLRKHSTEQTFSCDQPSCHFKTKHKSALLRHGQVVHSGEYPFECPSDGCDYKGKTKNHLRSHRKVHSNEKPFACIVQGCSYSGKTNGYLKAHVSKVHSGEKPFKCSTCDFRTKSNSNLIQHRLTHTKIKRFQCQAPNCGFASLQKHKVQRHFDAIHRKKNVRCTDPGCNYKCGSLTILQLHRKIHEIPMLKCPGDSCNFSTRHKTSLRRHMSRRHADLHAASNDGHRIFDVEIATAANAMGTLHCRFQNCDYKTKLQHHYDRHRITHQKEQNRQHICSFCFYRFSDLGKLRGHIRRHTGEKHYSCSHCQYATVDGVKFRRHARSFHHIHMILRGKEDEVTKCRTCNMNCWSHSEGVLHSMIHLQPIVALERLRVHVM